MRTTCLILSTLITLFVCYYTSFIWIELLEVADNLMQTSPDTLPAIISSGEIDVTLEPAASVLKMIPMGASLLCCSLIIGINTWWQRRLWKKK